MFFLLGLVFPADFVKYLFIDSLAVNMFAFGFKFFDHRLHHLALKNLCLSYTLISLTETAQILTLINPHCKPPVLSIIITYGELKLVGYFLTPDRRFEDFAAG
jgi:hypothetical protein